MTLESCSTEFPQAACTVTRTSPGSVNRVVTELSRESRGCGHKQDQACLAGWRAMVHCQDHTFHQQGGDWRFMHWQCLGGVGDASTP